MRDEVPAAPSEVPAVHEPAEPEVEAQVELTPPLLSPPRGRSPGSDPRRWTGGSPGSFP